MEFLEHPFIASGAFVGIDDIVIRRNGRKQIGFKSQQANIVNKENYGEYVNPEDIRDFGFIPEFVGRFPIITSVKRLTKDDLKHILQDPRDSIFRQYTELIEMDNTELHFTADAINEIVDLAYNLGTGARALRSIVETIMTDIMFDSPNNIGKNKKVKVTIDKAFIREKASKRYRLAV